MIGIKVETNSYLETTDDCWCLDVYLSWESVHCFMNDDWLPSGPLEGEACSSVGKKASSKHNQPSTHFQDFKGRHRVSMAWKLHQRYLSRLFKCSFNEKIVSTAVEEINRAGL